MYIKFYINSRNERFDAIKTFLIFRNNKFLIKTINFTKNTSLIWAGAFVENKCFIKILSQILENFKENF